MGAFLILPFLFYIAIIAGFIFVGYCIFRISKEQRKKTFLLKKLYEQRGGVLQPDEEAFLNS